MKKWFEPVSTAWVGVATHKLRSFLTILGVVIGVAAVIALMSIGKGAESRILSRIQGLGANLLFIQPGFVSEGGVRGGFGSASTLTFEDAQAIASEVPNIASVAPSSGTSLQVVYGGQNMRSRITGVTPDYELTFNLQVADGEFINDYHYGNSMRVAVLGPRVRETLFGEGDPIGQRIRMGSIMVEVIGVLQAKGGGGMGSTDDAILVPLTMLQQTVAQQRTSRGERIISSIAVSASDQRYTKEVVESITGLLLDRHQILDGANQDFTVTSMDEMAEAVSDAMRNMTLLLGAIAAISLLVGGIGVMNIMLVSVVERTREIGIRKALGARESDIWGQFLIEAAFLTFTGGLIGVTLGWGASYLVSRFGPMTTLVSPDIVILAVSVSVGIGLFFGFYPAWHASRLDPIEALRAQ